MKKIKFVCISTFLPRKCGIATFTKNFIDSILNSNLKKDIKKEAYVVALNDHNQQYEYPDIVKYIIRDNYQLDYLKAVKYINYSDADICIIQHEFGIFGGESGVYILPLIRKLEIPCIVIFHTVLKEPSYTEKAIINEIGKMAEKVVVMNKMAVDFLVEIYDVPKEKIVFIEHGIPDFDFIKSREYKKKFHLTNKKVLLTFGLLSRNKGIETVIQALPNVIKRHPDVIYIVLGKTHPNVERVSGEEYRNYLELLVEKNNLGEYVYFHNHFVSDDELFGYLSAADIYITPYLNEAQMTSGSLSYAVGSGSAVISTPYWHANELLSRGRGRLFNFGDSDALADILIELLDNPQEMDELRRKAYNYGRKRIWPEIGAKYLTLISDTVKTYASEGIKKQAVINPLILPTFCLKHIKRLTHDIGIVQHAKYNVPNLKEGYALDDNARALLMSLMAYRQLKDEDVLELIPVYLSFISYMQNEDGTFRNLLSFNRDFLDENGTEDSFGRTIWALGYLIHYPANQGYIQMSRDMFFKASNNFEKLKTLRGRAYTINGIYHYLRRFPGDETMGKILRDLAYTLVKEYTNEKDKDWMWFESKLAYSNAIIPLSIFYSYKIINDPALLHIAEESMEFLQKVTFKHGHISPVGNNGWYEKGKKCPQYAQQSIDVTDMMLLFYQAFVVTKDDGYINKMKTSFLWFLGDNDLGIPLYDFETCGCFDGLESYGVNRNQGAESTIAYLIANLLVLSAFEEVV